MPIKSLWALAAALGILGTPAAASAEPATITRKIVRPPMAVRPIPITTDSRPFLSSPLDLRSHGYVEEEFLISGKARAYDWVGNTLKIKAVTPPGPYVTRVLVLRPIDPKRFSGNVEVEAFNATNLVDVSTTLGTSADFLMRQGDVWVGFTSKPLTLRALKRFDPVRYASLEWSNPTPPEQRCEHPSIIPEYSMALPPGALQKMPAFSFPDSEDGLVFDIYAQLGALLKSAKRDQILPGFAKPHLFATGYSQSGLIQTTFINGFHNVMRLPGGGPIFDGYLVEVGPGLLRINQCSADVLPDDPRNRVQPTDAPVINIVSEGDMWLGLRTRRPDVIDGRTGVVTYELAGAAHKHGAGEAGRPTPAEAARAGVTMPAIPPPPGVILNDFPRHYLSAAALRNLQAWAREGRAPPVGQPLATEGGAILRDADGNARGGVRSPWIDVPTASYRGGLGLGAMAIVGSKTPLPPERLRSLYPTKADYEARFKASLEESVAGRWILPEDAPRILERAQAEHAAEAH
jgi:hypothetical protein